MSLRQRPIWLPLLLAVLCACSGAPQGPPAASSLPSASLSSPTVRSSPGPPPRPIVARVMVTGLPTLPHGLLPGQHNYRVADAAAHLDVTVPQLAGTAVFNRRLISIADTLVRSFRRTIRAQSGVDPGRYHSLNVGWQLLGRSDRTTGIQLWVAEQHGTSNTIDRVSVWYDASTRSLLALRDWFTPSAWPDVQNAIVTATARPGRDPASARQALAARPAPEDDGPAFAFSVNGDLVVTFAAGVITRRPVSVRVAGDTLLSRLTGVGRSARAAAVASPRPRAVVRTDCSRRRCAALTFDDGPGPFTAELVALLQRRKVPATFFMVGDRVRPALDLVATVQAARMQIGNHSSHHSDLTRVGAAAMRRDLQSTSRALAGVTGHHPILFRPPYGARNGQVDKVSKQLGLSEVLWDVDPLDWRYLDAARVRRSAVGQARRGSIILLHDIHRTSVAAVPGIITDLRRRGFTLVTVSQLLGGRPVAGQVYRRQSVASIR